MYIIITKSQFSASAHRVLIKAKLKKTYVYIIQVYYTALLYYLLDLSKLQFEFLDYLEPLGSKKESLPWFQHLKVVIHYLDVFLLGKKHAIENTQYKKKDPRPVVGITSCGVSFSMGGVGLRSTNSFIIEDRFTFTSK